STERIPKGHSYEKGVCTVCGARMPGDFTGDGRINVTDMLALRRLITGCAIPEDGIMEAADLNGDGKVNAIDAIYLRKMILGAD
ncbi:MAG: dockerin type I repeat-containing protein, partial [Clostridia bacterium]|nr:dockerin type I repeat-containing protein [Clostridia bacterium]